MQNSSKKILVVDDTIDNLNLLFEFFKLNDFVVKHVNGGLDALHFLENNLPELILMDIIMPGIDGYETCKKIKENPRTKDIPIIFLSALENTEDKVKAFNAGAVDYVSKPFHLEEVLVRVNTHIKLNYAQRELKSKDENYHLLSEYIDDVIWKLDVNTLKFTYISPSIYKLRGLTVEEAMNESMEESLMPDSFEIIKNSLPLRIQQFYEGALVAKSIRHELRQLHKDGRIIWIETITSFVTNSSGKITEVIGISRNIDERKRAEEKLKASIAEKETLLRELYHRTKNNMQVISSYLQLHTLFNNDEKLNNIIQEVLLRIQAMSLVHQKLYKAKKLSKINIKEYIEELIPMITDFLNLDLDKIKINTNIEDIELLFDIAIPIGMVIHELVSNSLKHAFPNEKSGNLEIMLYEEENNYIILRIADNGVGLPPNFELRNCKTIGILSIYSIVEKQLLGNLSYQNFNGLKIQIVFRNNIYNERI